MKPVRVFLALLLAGLAPLVRAQGSLVTLAAPTSAVVAGRPLQVEILIFNPSLNGQTFYLATALTGRLSNERESWGVTLQGGAGDIAVPAGGFARLPLSGIVPPKAAGRYILEITQPALARAVESAPAGCQFVRAEHGMPSETWNHDPGLKTAFHGGSY